jgi:secreted PhoX family phosphatase
MKDWTAEKTRKSQAAHGVAVIEVAQDGSGSWQMVRPSRYARRFTAATPFAVSGPAAGHPLMRTAADPSGRRVLGTLNNCASGMTPWGTYLSGEENWAFYFKGGDSLTADQRRWGLRKANAFYRWWRTDERWDARKHPNEFHRFGWVVEIDPNDPTSTPVKRTALGRAAHEGAWVAPRATAAPWSTWARTPASNTSTSSSAATASAPAAPRPTPSCWTTARCTWRASTPTAAAAGCRWCTARAR